MKKLKTERLTANVEMCFANSRDNSTFDADQRRGWLIQGIEQRSRLIILVGKEMSTEADSKVTEANAELASINKRLQDKEESLAKFSETINKITDSVAILDTLIGFVIGGQGISP